MHDFMLFLHLIGVAIWFGSLIMAAVLLVQLKKQAEEGEARTARTLVRVFNLLSHPAAFLVLLSGFGMLGTHSGGDGKGMPFWLTYMSYVGTIVVLLSMVVLWILGGKIVTKNPEEGEPSFRKDKLSTFLTVEVVVIALVLSILLVVSYRF
jgi:putative copper export protein